LLASLLADPTVEIIPLTDHLLGQAIELFSSRRDKEWGLTDCLSFVVMAGQGIDQALTTDMHFQQAGFKVLMSKQTP
jgi:predicted nucleic acid-binding protein